MKPRILHFTAADGITAHVFCFVESKQVAVFDSFGSHLESFIIHEGDNHDLLQYLEDRYHDVKEYLKIDSRQLSNLIIVTDPDGKEIVLSLYDSD